MSYNIYNRRKIYRLFSHIIADFFFFFKEQQIKSNVQNLNFSLYVNDSDGKLGLLKAGCKIERTESEPPLENLKTFTANHICTSSLLTVLTLARCVCILMPPTLYPLTLKT